MDNINKHQITPSQGPQPTDLQTTAPYSKGKTPEIIKSMLQDAPSLEEQARSTRRTASTIESPKANAETKHIQINSLDDLNDLIDSYDPNSKGKITLELAGKTLKKTDWVDKLKHPFFSQVTELKVSDSSLITKISNAMLTVSRNPENKALHSIKKLTFKIDGDKSHKTQAIKALEKMAKALPRLRSFTLSMDKAPGGRIDLKNVTRSINQAINGERVASTSRPPQENPEIKNIQINNLDDLDNLIDNYDANNKQKITLELADKILNKTDWVDKLKHPFFSQVTELKISDSSLITRISNAMLTISRNSENHTLHNIEKITLKVDGSKSEKNEAIEALSKMAKALPRLRSFTLSMDKAPGSRTDLKNITRSINRAINGK